VDRDGNCLVRSILVALRLPASDRDVDTLRKTMATLMRQTPQFFDRFVLGRDPESKTDADQLKAFYDGVETWAPLKQNPLAVPLRQIPLAVSEAEK